MNTSQQSPSKTGGYVFVLGFALFAMFFGAGNLIFPPMLGKLAGDQFPFAVAGFLLTGVGLPLAGIFAAAKADGGLDQIASKVDPLFGKILSFVVMLAIGPMLAIPRTCATTYELGIAPNMPWIGSWLFSFIYFGVVLFFVLSPLSVIDRIGKYLTPLLLLSIMALIVAGIIHPIAAPVATGIAHPFGKSFIEGYQTMDLMAAAIFGIVILTELRNKGLADKTRQFSIIAKAGVISAVSLAVVYGGLIYLGATTGAFVENVTRTELLIGTANTLLGSVGGVILGVAVSMACLTTAIGLAVVCGQYFSRVSGGKVSYKVVCLGVCAVSLVFANAGVEMIVKIALPLLVAVYPVVILLIFLTLAGKIFDKPNIWQGAVAGAFLIGLLDSAKSLGIQAAPIDAIFAVLPLTDHGMGWIAPAVILGIVGAIISRRKSTLFRV